MASHIGFFPDWVQFDPIELCALDLYVSFVCCMVFAGSTFAASFCVVVMYVRVPAVHGLISLL